MTHSEAVLEARRKLQAGDFQRAIVERVPDDLHYDRFTLECGHTKVWHSRSMPIDGQEKTLCERCDQCAKEWIAQNFDASE